MKLIHMIAAWFVMTGWVLAAKPLVLTEATSEQPPRIEIPQPTFDFGTVIAGQDIVHEYEVLNTGAADLEIIDVDTG